LKLTESIRRNVRFARASGKSSLAGRLLIARVVAKQNAMNCKQNSAANPVEPLQFHRVRFERLVWLGGGINSFLMTYCWSGHERIPQST
jgi:hypothetical protein